MLINRIRTPRFIDEGCSVGANMKYEKPKLIELKTTTAVGGEDCTPTGSAALDKCQMGGTATAGDCDTGSVANVCKTGGSGN